MVSQTSNDPKTSTTMTASLLDASIASYTPVQVGIKTVVDESGSAANDNHPEPTISAAASQNLQSLFSVLISAAESDTQSLSVLGSETYKTGPLQTSPTAVIYTANGEAITASAISVVYVVGGQTVNPGAGAVLVSGTTVSIPTGGDSLFLGSETYRAVSLQAIPTAVVFTASGEAFTASTKSEAYVINGQTVTPGASAVVVSGITISVPTGGSSISLNGKSYAPSPQTTPTAVLFTANGKAITASTIAGSYIVAGETVTPGGAVVVSGTTIFVPTGRKSLFLNENAYVQSPQTISAPMVFTASGEDITASAIDGAHIIAGRTVTPGASAIVVSGITLSIPTDGRTLIVNGESLVLAQFTSTTPGSGVLAAASATATTSSSANLGGLIMSGLAGSKTSTTAVGSSSSGTKSGASGTGTAPAHNSSTRNADSLPIQVWCLVLALAVVGMIL